MSSKNTVNVNPTRKIDMKVLKRLLSYMTQYKLRLVLVFALILVSALVSAGSAMFVEILIDDYITPLLLMDQPVFTGLLKMLCIMAVIYAIGAFSGYMYNRLMVTMAQSTLKRIRDEMFDRMQYLPVRYFDTHTHGEIMSLYTNDTDTLRQLIAQSMAHLVSSICTMIAVFCCMLYLSVWLTLIVLLSVFVIINVVRKVTGKTAFFFVRQQQSIGALNGYIEEMINGQKVIKVFCHEDKNVEGFAERNEAWRLAATNANGRANSMMPMMNGLGYATYVLIAVAGSYMAISGVPNLGFAGTGTITVGVIASFLTLSRNFVNPISQMANQFNSVVMALAGAERIFNFMDELPETDEGYVSLVNAKEEDGEIVETPEHTGMWAWRHPHKADGTVTYTKLEGRVVLDHVDFSYVEGKEVLHDITLYAEPGQKVAFVGATGVGKTTITNLINRFYDIDDGKIRYDGININKIKKQDLRRSLGVVLQDVYLFTGTVMENIRYGNPKATDEECIAAAKLANADGFIRMLPDGYDTLLKDGGSGLSQGQRQLISIARAAVADPPVMILDEATSSIDTHTEALVQEGMDRLMKGRTVFVIAHRLSTVQNSDVIMVLDHGRIIERGNHQQLIDKKGVYYQLYTGAFELE